MDQRKISYDALHWVAVVSYAVICAIGFANMWYGLILLGIYAIMAAFKAIFSNPTMLVTILIIVGISTVFPPIAFLLPVIAVFLFFKRIGFIASHIKVVASGLFIYVFAIILCTAGNHAYGYFPIAMGIVPGLIAGAVMHGIMHATKKWGYATAQSLEIMSVVPLLIAAMILPFLKFDIGLDHMGVDTHAPLGTTVVDHAGGSAESAALSYGIGKTGTPEIIIDPHTPVFETANASTSAGMLASSKSAFHSNFEAPQHHNISHTTRVTDSLGRTQHYIESSGSGEVIKSGAGISVGHIEHGVNSDYLKDNLGRTVLTKVHGVTSDTIYNQLHQPIGHVEHSGNTDYLKDNLGRTVLTKEHGVSSDTLYNKLHQPIGHIEHGNTTASENAEKTI